MDRQCSSKIGSVDLFELKLYSTNYEAMINGYSCSATKHLDTQALKVMEAMGVSWFKSGSPIYSFSFWGESLL